MNIDMQAVHETMQPKIRKRWARLFRAAYLTITIVGVVGVIAVTVPNLHRFFEGVFWFCFSFAALFFTAEYAARLYVAPFEPGRELNPHWQTRVIYARSTMGMIDLIAVLPAAGIVILGAHSSGAYLFGILWILKLLRYTPGWSTLLRVFQQAWEPLLSVFVAFIIVLLSAGTLLHALEQDVQPDKFGSIPDALWWAIVTLTTTGYGDVTPVTSLGRMISGVVMVCGIGVFALWAGILANAFAGEVRRRSFLRTWDMLTKVPLFQNLSAETIADISRVLKHRDVSDGSAVFYRGDRGDCMYFIVYGEIEVQMPTAPLVLSAGEFFGEMSLITGACRSATTRATKETLLLALDIADFRDIASRRPDLSLAVHEEARRRMGQGQAESGEGGT
ncbi:MAG: cyclic nucleotide-gated ion channel/potassium channel family protein [Rhodospirillales bacterium]|nr:cyclic nucleotide-gated ion channel/potassium channel family protein [Rhodospirillales bacterium]